MFQLEHDGLIIREEGKIAYFATIFILFYLQLYILLIFYAIVGISLIVFDDVADELHEDEIYSELAKHQDLHTVEERLGTSLIYDDLVNLLEIVREDPVLTTNYRLADTYLLSMAVCNVNIKDKFSYILTENLSYAVTTSNIRRFLKHKLVLTTDFNERFVKAKVSKDPVKLEMMKYKTLSLVVNDFLVGSFIARGVFPGGDYDYDLFHSNNNSVNVYFLEYLLLTADEDWQSLDVDLENFDIKKVNF